MLHVRQDDRASFAEVRTGPCIGDEVDGFRGVADEDDLFRTAGVDEPGDLVACRLERRRRFLGDRVDAAGGCWRSTGGSSRPWRRAPLVASVMTTPNRGRRGACRSPRLEDREVLLQRGDVDLAHRQATCSRKVSNPIASTVAESSGQPDSTTRPSTRTWTTSGARWSRMRW